MLPSADCMPGPRPVSLLRRSACIHELSQGPDLVYGAQAGLARDIMNVLLYLQPHTLDTDLESAYHRRNLR